MKVYTKTGDSGQTSLFGGQRISKGHQRIEAYGIVDKLNAQLGVVRVHLEDADLDDLVHRIQSELFTLGADLATPNPVQSPHLQRVSPPFIARLEGEIDGFEAELPRLQSFILPGGSVASAYLHVARTTCREAERATVRLAEADPVNELAVIYLNRLSDWLFVLARLVNHRHHVADVPWHAPAP